MCGHRAFNKSFGLGGKERRREPFPHTSTHCSRGKFLHNIFPSAFRYIISPSSVNFRKYDSIEHELNFFYRLGNPQMVGTGLKGR